MSIETRQIPAAALRMSGGKAEFGDNGVNSKTVPVKILARTGDAIEHPYWGRVVHDMAGMIVPKPRIVLDSLHDDNEPVGYANKFDTSSGDLWISGAVTPVETDDKANKIIAQAKSGVPFQASINFNRPGIQIEEIPEGEIVTVNNRQFVGPLNVIRSWTLEGCAICPHGADGGTETLFKSGDSQTAKVTKREKANTMSNENEKVVIAPAEKVEDKPTELTAVEAKVEAKAVEAPTVETPVSVEAAASVEAPAEAVQLTQTVEATKPVAVEAPAVNATTIDPQAECKRFMAEFGESGAKWFADGKTFPEAQSLYVAELKTQIAKLSEENKHLVEIDKQLRGEEKPVKFCPAPAELTETQAKRRQYAKAKAGELGEGVAALASKFAVKQA